MFTESPPPDFEREESVILDLLLYWLYYSKKATKKQTLVAIVLWIKPLPKCLYQKETDFLLGSRDI